MIRDVKEYFHRVMLCEPNGTRSLTDVSQTQLGMHYLRTADILQTVTPDILELEDLLAAWFEPVHLLAVDDVKIIGQCVLLNMFLDMRNDYLEPSAEYKAFQERFWAELGGCTKLPDVPILDVPSRIKDIADDVRRLIGVMKHAVEEQRCLEPFFRRGRRISEKDIQAMFSPLAFNYCRDRNYDFSTEPQAGVGPVDFKISQSFEQKVLIEFKLSTNTSLVAGFINQITAYQRAEMANMAFYVVFDIGDLGNRFDKICALRGERVWPCPILISAKQQPSASKR